MSFNEVNDWALYCIVKKNHQRTKEFTTTFLKKLNEIKVFELSTTSDF